MQHIFKIEFKKGNKNYPHLSGFIIADGFTIADVTVKKADLI